MKTYDVVCPICGKFNRGLYLEETEGWMECDSCENTMLVEVSNTSNKLIPVYAIKKLRSLQATY